MIWSLRSQHWQKSQLANAVVVARDGAEALDYLFRRSNASRNAPVR